MRAFISPLDSDLIASWQQVSMMLRVALDVIVAMSAFVKAHVDPNYVIPLACVNDNGRTRFTKIAAKNSNVVTVPS